MSRFINIAAAREASGLRMACLRGVPSPWTEAAKGIFHVKGLDCQYAAQGDEDVENAISAWAGDSSVPVVAFANEPLRTGWLEILLLAERLAPQPGLIPADPEARAWMLGLAQEICGPLGFGWCVRLEMLRLGMSHADDGGGRGFPPEVTSRLASKYGFNPTDVGLGRTRIVEVLKLLDSALAERDYLVGDTLTALDVYWATFANLPIPLPGELLPAVSFIRKVYTSEDAELLGAISARLRAHQRNVYEQHLELPVPL